MKFPALPWLRPSDEPLRYVPDSGSRMTVLDHEPTVPYPAHLSVR